MNTVQNIATQIAARGHNMGWKAGTKTADNLNLEAWAGAWAALAAVAHPDQHHIARVVTMVIAVRGYAATLRIAENAAK